MERKWFKCKELVTKLLSAAGFQTFANARQQWIYYPLPTNSIFHSTSHTVRLDPPLLRNWEVSVYCSVFHVQASSWNEISCWLQTTNVMRIFLQANNNRNNNLWVRPEMQYISLSTIYLSLNTTTIGFANKKCALNSVLYFTLSWYLQNYLQIFLFVFKSISFW